MQMFCLATNLFSLYKLEKLMSDCLGSSTYELFKKNSRLSQMWNFLKSSKI